MTNHHRRGTAVGSLPAAQSCGHGAPTRTVFIGSERVALCASCSERYAADLLRGVRATAAHWSWQADNEAAQINRGTRIVDPFEPKRELT